ncbi:TIGR02269 family lipoprotein [Myxococcaceae bacterium GXIMD 01537]
MVPSRRLAALALLGALLASCASSGPASRGVVEAEAEPVSWEEGWADSRCVTVLCGEGSCAFVRCRDTRHEQAGQVVLARGGAPPVVAPPAPRGSPRRWWAGGLWLPEDREPVFVIPWNGGNTHRRLRPDVDALLRGGKWVHHHIFPQEARLALWFSRQGIDIHQFTLVIPQRVHVRIHSGGSRGGQWNDAWREFVDARPKRPVPQAEIWAHAHELIRRFGLNPGPFEPYR